MKNRFLTKNAAILICILYVFNGFAQVPEPGKGRATIYFEPRSKVIVRLDTVLLIQSKLPVSLKAGQHIIRAWAPRKELFTDTIRILENKTTIVTRTLKNSEGYEKYREAMRAYRFKKITSAYVPLGLTTGYSIFTVIRYKNNKKLVDQHLANAQIDALDYSKPNSQDGVEIYQQAYVNEKNSYETYRLKNNQIVKTGTIVASTCVVASAALLYFSSKIIKPAAYSEVPLLSFNSINLKSDYPSTCSLGVILNIKSK
jgi:hypothetical protein